MTPKQQESINALTRINPGHVVAHESHCGYWKATVEYDSGDLLTMTIAPDGEFTKFSASRWD